MGLVFYFTSQVERSRRDDTRGRAERVSASRITSRQAGTGTDYGVAATGDWEGRAARLDKSRTGHSGTAIKEHHQSYGCSGQRLPEMSTV